MPRTLCFCIYACSHVRRTLLLSAHQARQLCRRTRSLLGWKGRCCMHAGVVPSDPRQPWDVRSVLARLLDGSRFDEFKARQVRPCVCTWCRTVNMRTHSQA